MAGGHRPTLFARQPGGQRLGPLLAEVLQAHAGGGEALHRARVGAGRARPGGEGALYLNPGLTFGTGSHASTQLCLMGLEQYTVPGKPVLDLGCGSGILSIAALVLGASAATAVDIDPKAVDVAYENAALNGIGRDRYNVRAGNVLTDGALVAELARRKYALVLANIVADVIIPLSAKAGEFLDTDGVFLCSGIIDTRAGEVEAALERNGLAVFERRSRTVGGPGRPCGPVAEFKRGVRASLVRTPFFVKRYDEKSSLWILADGIIMRRNGLKTRREPH